MAVNYKEYSRLRSIARKRLERASAAGLAPNIHIPTVAEVRLSGDPEKYMAAVKRFIEQPTTVKEIRKNPVKFDGISFPAVKAKNRKLSESEKRARRNEQKRRSKAKRAVEKAAPNAAEGRKRAGYLKALETVAKKWRDAGMDVGNWLGVMSPGKAQKFVEYMEYRFSQGDYKNRYTIDTFIRDFGTLVQKGYDFKDIQSDFGSFLVKQKQLSKNKEKVMQYGIAEDEVDSVWRKFVNR